MTTLVWFQRDLRVTCHPGLNRAIELQSPIVAVYIHSPSEDSPWSNGTASNWWLHQSIEALSLKLQSLGIELQLFNSDSQAVIPRIVKHYAIKNVIWTDRHEPFRRTYENALETKLCNSGVHVERFRDELLVDPGNFVTLNSQTPYRVFTPFFRRLRGGLDFSGTETYQYQLSCNLVPKHPESLSLPELGLLDAKPWHEKLRLYWQPGEESALQQLNNIVSHRLSGYASGRDYPAQAKTSSLSPHLHFGEISPRQVIGALLPILHPDAQHSASDTESFIRQLIWREFARYILWHYPETVTEPMDKRFQQQFWTKNDTVLQKWKKGETGIPILDAGMHQLWETGWMHNRIRMLVASFLTKNLGIHWHEGAKWFWDTLVDADLANNTMGWQWVAGCGVDASPYFRIFNPVIQSKRYDPEAEYINRWNSMASYNETQEPITDPGVSRKMALSRYQNIIKPGRK